MSIAELKTKMAASALDLIRQGFAVYKTEAAAFAYARERTTAGKAAWDDAVRMWAMESIARREFHTTTLESRGRDSLDFHTVSVESIKAALAAAFEAGRESAK